MLSVARPLSKLRFVVGPDFQGESQLTRVRKAVSRSKAGVQGKVADVATGKSLHAESLNELAAFRIILACARVDLCQEQPCVLEFHYAGQRHRYTPDVLLAWGTYRELVEIKDDADAELPENQERFVAVKEALAGHGYEFRVWRKSEILAEPRISNSVLVLRYRAVCPSTLERERIRRTLAEHQKLTISALARISGASIQSTLRLVLDGTLHINWWEQLTRTSQISSFPIGQQTWPCPPSLLSRALGMSHEAVF